MKYDHATCAACLLLAAEQQALVGTGEELSTDTGTQAHVQVHVPLVRLASENMPRDPLIALVDVCDIEGTQTVAESTLLLGEALYTISQHVRIRQISGRLVFLDARRASLCWLRRSLRPPQCRHLAFSFELTFRFQVVSLLPTPMPQALRHHSLARWPATSRCWLVRRHGRVACPPPHAPRSARRRWRQTR